MYVQRKISTATIVAVEKQCVLHTVCVCVFVASSIQNALRVRSLPSLIIFFHIIS